MSASFFADVEPPEFRWYEKDRMVLGKRMEDHLRFAVAYWHSLCWPGSDPFGGDTFRRPWMDGGDTMAGARQKADVAFELFPLLDVPYFCFHDRGRCCKFLLRTKRGERGSALLIKRPVDRGAV